MVNDSSFRWEFLPYCLIKQPDGTYVITNRHYRPLGMTGGEKVNYETWPGRVRFKRLAAPTIKLLQWDGSADADRIYLYNDGCLPDASPAHWEAYSQKLQRLAKIGITPVD